jgi:hypothetical protein
LLLFDLCSPEKKQVVGKFPIFHLNIGSFITKISASGLKLDFSVRAPLQENVRQVVEPEALMHEDNGT